MYPWAFEYHVFWQFQDKEDAVLVTDHLLTV